MNKVILIVVLFSSYVAVLALSPDNTTQQMHLYSGYDTVEPKY
jgi:hypothetical protein